MATTTTAPSAQGILGGGTSGSLLSFTASTYTSGTTLLVSGGQQFSGEVDGNSLTTCGYNNLGQLGDGNANRTDTPVGTTLGASTVISFAGGAYSSIALLSNGTVWATGDNTYGELGSCSSGGSSDSFVQVHSICPPLSRYLQNVTAIAAGPGGYTFYALRNNGTVFAWGRGDSGQIGNGTTTTNNSHAIQVLTASGSGLSGIASIGAGDRNGYAIDSSSNVYGWGDDTDGQLVGSGTPDYAVNILSGSNGATKVVGGNLFQVVLLSNGHNMAAGNNTEGQLGFGDENFHSGWVSTKNTSNIVDLAAGSVHTVALDNSGEVWVWGGNGLGQMCDGTFNNRDTPAVVVQSGASGIGAGEGNSFMIK